MRVFAVASYPVEAAASRYRVIQYIPHLHRHGIDVEFSPFLSSAAFRHLYDRSRAPRTAAALAAAFARRLFELITLKNADVLFVQREAMLFGPALFEWIASMRIPMILDLDDPTYLGTIHSVYGKMVEFIRWPRKVPHLIRRASVVLCGNDEIARHVEEYGVPTRVVPTVVDSEQFHPRGGTPESATVIGWIGTRATYPYLQDIFPILERLAEKHSFRLKIVGSGHPAPMLRNVDVDCSDWQLEREARDFQSLDIGLYPLRDEAYAHGKSGFKAIQYMTVGVPFVASPVGVCGTMGEHGRTHLLAANADAWYETLDRLLADATLRAQMGARGRQHALKRYTIEQQADAIAAALHESLHVRNRRNRRAIDA